MYAISLTVMLGVGVFAGDGFKMFITVHRFAYYFASVNSNALEEEILPQRFPQLRDGGSLNGRENLRGGGGTIGGWRGGEVAASI
jgi:hypothetical protein